MTSPKQLVLLGATGSIGDSTLKVCRQHPERLRVAGIAGNRRWRALAPIAREFGVRHVCVFDEPSCAQARDSGEFPPETVFYCGLDGLTELACLDGADTVVAAVVGTISLRPALAALNCGKHLALASKELLVMAGKFVTDAARANGCDILPLDSEHNAIFQCLHGEDHGGVDRIILTASGGPFRDFTAAQMRTITKAQALKHPNWDMGPKVTIDSSTMANKGLEVIEAHWLFGLLRERIGVVVHPQSIVHSMVQYVDGSIVAQLSPPHMCFAIQHALLHPHRAAGCVPTLDFSEVVRLEFRPPDYERFPCLRLAMEAMEAGGAAPAVFNAANEAAVEAFVAEQIHYLDIAAVIEATLDAVAAVEPQSLDEVLAVDTRARRVAAEIAADRAGGAPSFATA